MTLKKPAGKTKKSRRTALRFKLENKKITYLANGRMGRATLQNISTSGCFATKNNTDLAVNDQILIVVELEIRDKPLELKAKVVRIGDGGFSAQFTHIDESFQTELSTLLAAENRSILLNQIPIEK